MTALNTVKPDSSAVNLAVLTVAHPTRQCVAIPSVDARHRLRACVWPVARLSASVGARQRSPLLVFRVAGHKVGNHQLVESEFRRLFLCVACCWCAHPSLVCQPPTRQRQSATTQTSRPAPTGLRQPAKAPTRLCGFGRQRCISPPMKNVSLGQHRPWPNPALKRNANSAARRPSSARHCGPFCARCPARHAAGVRLALR